MFLNFQFIWQKQVFEDGLLVYLLRKLASLAIKFKFKLKVVCSQIKLTISTHLLRIKILKQVNSLLPIKSVTPSYCGWFPFSFVVDFLWLSVLNLIRFCMLVSFNCSHLYLSFADCNTILLFVSFFVSSMLLM